MLGMTSGVVIDAAICTDGRLDVFDDIHDMAEHLTTLAGRRDGTAVGMSQHDHQRRPQMLHGIFDGTQHM